MNMSTEEEILYHYTSVETLFNILHEVDNDHIKLRANYFMNMNDPIDCRYLFSEIKQILADNNNQKDSQDIIEDTILKIGIPYIISLSSAKDNLPMWNMYAQKGHGISIGFSKKEIEGAIAMFQNKGHAKQRVLSKQCFCRLYQCHYWNKNEIIDNFVQKKLLNKAKSNDKDTYSMSYLIKHPSYKYEEESRIVFLYSPNQENCPNYIELHVPISAIKVIICGPCIKKKFLEALIPSGIRVDIEQSQIPYNDSPLKKCPQLQSCNSRNKLKI